MNIRKPVKDLVDLKLTIWYESRKPIIKEAINNYPPGYYTFSGNGEEYLLVGWSEPTKKEEVVQVFLEREIEEGTERLRVDPKYISVADFTEIAEASTEENPEEIVSIGITTYKDFRYILGRLANEKVQYLKEVDGTTNRVFEGMDGCHTQLTSMGVPKEDFDKFIYTIVHER